MDIYTLCGYFIAFILYSVIGWCVEVLLSLIRNKKFVDRGFLLGPYCPIYGYGGILIVLFLNKYSDNVLVLFILAMVLCLVLEYFTSYFMELIFKARWWDYSDKRFNINGRVCLEYGIFFGLGGLIIMYLVHPFIFGVVNKFSKVWLLIVGIILFVIYLIDNIITFSAMSNINGIEFKKYMDNTEDISDKIKEYLMEHSYFTKRIVKAFPGVHMRLEKIKNNIKK